MARKKKVNLPLIEVVAISVALHIVMILVLGGITIYTAMQVEDPELEAPPPAEAIDPQKLELQVKLQDQQKKSSKQVQRITVQNISEMNVPTIDINMPTVDTRVSVNVAAGGLGRGFGNGGIDIAKSAVDFFGIRDRGENIAFILDTARSMVEPERGDVKGFARVKEEISTMIEGLSAGTLFNIYAFDNNLETFRSKPVAASKENRKAAIKWIMRFWDFKNGRFAYQGATGFNNAPDMTGLPIRRNRFVGTRGDPDNTVHTLVDLSPSGQAVGQGTSRVDLAILAAAEGGADAIFMLTDGTPSISREVGDRELKEFNRRLKDFWRKAEGNRDYAKYLEARKAFHKKVADYQAARRKKGLPPEIREGGYPGGFRPPTAPQGIGSEPYPSYQMNMDQIVSMISKRVREIYKAEGKTIPPLHVVGYATGDKEQKKMEELQKKFRGGQFRKISGTELLKREPAG